MKFVGIIPARYQSTRFPGKPLVDIGGKSMIQRVYEQAKLALEDVWVATDDIRIQEAVELFGGNVVMTSPDHKSGTDRCHEAYLKIDNEFDVVINIQGDEPFIQQLQIETLKHCFDTKQVQLATLVKPFKPEDGLDALLSPNTPKVVLTKESEAIYFSRSVIPYLRDVQQSEWLSNHTFYKHIGMYAYRTDVLKEITQLDQTTLELSESLEQLRWIENGYKIKVGLTNIETIGIDTPKDLQKALKLLHIS
ncbi:MAG: 3-deoxy-manno-octulosonate cytidylyltransferase [Bacteroidota bacterium]|jgi:3-deoxy-manno-octulosonate cytidylyltransferase (CMP-KDO synthetase)